MANIWEKFDKAIDVEGLQKDVQEAAENGANFREVPHGEYEVKIEKLELVESKAGDPMVTVWFKVLAGDYKGSMIFMNQVITKGFQIHIMNEFLRSLDSGYDVEFRSYSQYGQLLMDIHEAIDGELEYLLKYSEGKKGFSNYEIVDVYDVEE
ncbi:MAG TPA: DUF669 domain-containing protein [Thermodesulfovibrio thiophilus]|jgi:hypothetical protein|nr:DUF669 domain-containing protein [Candidatus Pacearchaeota archaeon]HQD37179.1 DUF669 domain-containing protein [Thermodesulfovibrio thiophilus]